MDIGTVGGLLLGFVACIGSFMMEGGSPGAFIMLPAIIVVVGGTFATVFIGNSLKVVLALPQVIMIAIFPKTQEFGKVIDIMVEFATIARRDGVLALEREVENVKDFPFLYNGMMHLIDGLDAESAAKLMEEEKDYIEDRHHSNAGIFKKMGGYAPTMGIIGTVMGLVQTLASAGGDPVALVHHISSAFIATLWGVFTANLIYLPLGDKLEFISNEESLLLDIVTNGIISIQSGTSPTLIRRNLELMLPPSERMIETESGEE